MTFALIMSKKYEKITYDFVNKTLCNSTKSQKFIEHLNLTTNNYTKWIFSFGYSVETFNEIGNLSIDLITIDMTCNDIKEVIEMITNIETNREYYIKWLHEFIKPTYNAKHVMKTIESITKIDFDKLDKILKIAEKYKTETAFNLINTLHLMFEMLETNGLNITESNEIITSLLLTFDDILQKSDMSTHMYELLTHSYTKAFAVESDKIIANWIKSMSHTLIFFKVPLHRNDYLNFKSMLNLMQDMTKSSCEIEIIQLFTQYLIPKIVNSHEECLNSLNAIYKIDKYEREEILKLTSYFLGDLKIIGIFDSISKRLVHIPNNRTRIGMIPNNRFNIVARSLLYLHNYNSSHYEYYQLAQKLLECKAHQYIYIGDMKQIAEFNNSPYEIGINIHSSGRVGRTNEAIKTLIEYWNPTEDDISYYFSEFWKDLQLIKNKIKLEAILDTLGLNSNGSYRNIKNTQSFNGLLNGINGIVTLNNIKIAGIELIARFWHFACTYKPEDNEKIENEISNIKQAIFNNLEDGLENDENKQLDYSEHVVCDDGKVQRLVCSTLQGRLKDKNGLYVDIDKLGLNIVKNKKKLSNRITNLEIIHQYMQPFIAMLNSQKEIENSINKSEMFQGISDTSVGNCIPKSANEFFRAVFEYIDKLESGKIAGFIGENIMLDIHKVVYYVRMMSPTGIKNELDINPNTSIINTYSELYNYPDLFQVEDYMSQFGNDEIVILKKEIETRKQKKLQFGM